MDLFVRVNVSGKANQNKNNVMARSCSEQEILKCLAKHFKHDSFKSELQRRAVLAVVQGEWWLGRARMVRGEAARSTYLTLANALILHKKYVDFTVKQYVVRLGHNVKILGCCYVVLRIRGGEKNKTATPAHRYYMG